MNLKIPADEVETLHFVSLKYYNFNYINFYLYFKLAIDYMHVIIIAIYLSSKSKSKMFFK